MADTKYTSIDDLTYSNEANTAVFMTVTFESNPTPVRFNASPDDPMDYGRQMCADALTGKFGPIKKYVPIPAPRYTREQYKQKVQMLLDSVAKQQGFDSMLAAVPNCLERRIGANAHRSFFYPSSTPYVSII